jgi:hypothetical protein
VWPAFEWTWPADLVYGEIESGAEWEAGDSIGAWSRRTFLLFIGRAFLDSQYWREVKLPAAVSELSWSFS